MNPSTKEEVVDDDDNEPQLQTHVLDPNVVETLNVEDVDEVTVDVNPTIEPTDEPKEPMKEPDEDPVQEPVRRSYRANAGQTSRFSDYNVPKKQAFSGMTRGYGIALAHLRIKSALERHGKTAYEAIKNELTQLFITKKALVPKLAREVWKNRMQVSQQEVIRSHMF